MDDRSTCSGDMYPIVPTAAPSSWSEVEVSVTVSSSAAIRASPKSRSLM
jgi:hypothetical protein